MQNEVRSTFTTPVLAFLAGATLGAIVVALTTPRKGSDLREDLSDLGHRAKAKMEAMVRRGERAFEAAGEAAEPSLGDQAGEAWKDLKHGASRAGRDIKEGLGSARQDLSV
jgi:gas vesicle protein